MNSELRYEIDIDSSRWATVKPEWDFSTGRKRMTIEGGWNDKYLDIIKEKNITALNFNVSLGWRGQDFSFLQSIIGRGIKQIDIIIGESTGLEVIGELTELCSLKIVAYTKSAIDFSHLTNLRRVALDWWPGANSIFDLECLEVLGLYDCRLKNLERIASFPNLKKLDIRNSSFRDLGFIDTNNQLDVFWLRANRSIVSFEPLTAMKNLQRLMVDECRGLSNIEFVQDFERLEHFDFSACGAIPTIRPACQVKTLKALGFFGSTNIIDGDLSCLTKLPKLAMLGFASRKHYTHKLIKKWNWNNFDKPDNLLEKK